MNPTHAGQPVIDEDGVFGMTTGQPAVRGSRAGQIGVIFVGMPYSTWNQVDELRVVTVDYALKDGAK